MRKYFLLFALPAICLALLAGCIASAEPEDSVDPYQSEDIADWDPTSYETVNNLTGVTMTVEEETVSSTGLTVKFENESNGQCIYGEHFGLEKFSDGKWHQVPVAIDGDYGFEAIGYELSPGDSGAWAVDWQWLYGSLDAGEYRIVKEVLDFRDTGDFDTYYLAAEFTV